MRGPLGAYGIAHSQLERIGYNPLQAQGGPLEQALGGGGGGFGFSLAQPQGYTRDQYEAAMADRYANTRIGTGPNDYGYTGQGVTARAGTMAASNPYVYGSRVNAPLGGVGSSNPRKNYFNGRRVTGGR